jgi:phage-related protein
MSFLYDRDQNVTGSIPAAFAFKPSYGTTVSFNADLSQYETTDNYVYTMPKGANHLQLEFQMNFDNRKEEQARQIVGYFETLNGTGYFQYTDPASFYKPINLFANNFGASFDKNDLYTVNAVLNSDQISTLLNWNNPLMLQTANVKGDWATSTSYVEYDIVKYTGNATFPSNMSNLYDSFYYCTGDHTSDASYSSSNMANDKWTRDFFFQPTYSARVEKETAVVKTELPYSYTKRTDFGLHSNTLKSFNLEFRGVSDKEARCILHFLISKQGFRRFQYKIPKIYNQNKFFFSSRWSHTMVYKNVNDISVTIEEDPLGVRKSY